jgi:hypothetical protein
MIPKSGNKNVDTAITIAVIILIIYVLNKVLGLIKNPLDTLGVTTETTDRPNPEEWVLPTDAVYNYPMWQYETWADSLTEALFGGLGEDEETINNIMYNINSDGDLMAVIKAFGTQGTWNSGYGTLPNVLRALTPELVNGFNDHYAGWKMKGRL